MIDAGGFNEQPEYKFDFVFLVDAGLMFVFLYSIPCQVYKARKFGGKTQPFLIGLREILENPVGKDLFRQHLVSEFSVENLNFYEAAMAYKQLFLAENKSRGISKYNVARNLYNRFFSGNHGNDVNVSWDVKRDLKQQLKATRLVEEGLFDTALQQVFDLMQNDSFSRFRNTEEYKNFVGLAGLATLPRKRDITVSV